MFYDLSSITRFSPETVAVLAACIASDTFTKGMNSRGNLPANHLIEQAFRESGFFDHVSIHDRQTRSRKTTKLIHRITDFKVNPDLARACCKTLLEKTDRKYQDELEPLYVIIIEAMQNTNNHASAGKQVQYDWWLYQTEDTNKGIIHYTFLDIGVGVFESLPVRDFKRRVMELFNYKDNLDLVSPLLNGRIKSRTLMPNRGKGIPQIYQQSKDNMFQEFYILSNDILINTKTDTKLKLSEEFQGTLYYWNVKINQNEYTRYINHS